MPRQLPTDCIIEIFEYLEDDKATLHSCILVNRHWCEASVGILWRNVWRFASDSEKSLQIVDTLIACLPNESKDLLFKNEIFIEISDWKPPLFNYASFCKILSIYAINVMIYHALESHFITSLNLNYNKYLVFQEVLKMFMKQIPSLKSLDYNLEFPETIQLPFTYFPGASDCLVDLTVFSCDSNLYSEVFYQLSQICHNIQTLTIVFESFVSNGLEDLISLQKNLKHVKLITNENEDENCWTKIIPSLNKFSLTITRLEIRGYYNCLSLSFLNTFSNL